MNSNKNNHTYNNCLYHEKQNYRRKVGIRPKELSYLIQIYSGSYKHCHLNIPDMYLYMYWSIVENTVFILQI